MRGIGTRRDCGRTTVTAFPDSCRLWPACGALDRLLTALSRVRKGFLPIDDPRKGLGKWELMFRQQLVSIGVRENRRALLRRGFLRGSLFLFCGKKRQASSQKTPRDSNPGVLFPLFPQDVTRFHPVSFDSPIFESPTGVRKPPGWSRSAPGILARNSRTLALTLLSELTTRSHSDPGFVTSSRRWVATGNHPLPRFCRELPR